MAGEGTVVLATLLDRVPGAVVSGDPTIAIAAIETDSRVVGAGALFVALSGQHDDGHRHVTEAIANGARAVVVADVPPSPPPTGVTMVRVANTRRALSGLAAVFYGDPSASMDVVGITGTNGKTTVAHMIAAILGEAGVPCGIVGTVGARFATRAWPVENTTPLPPRLHELLGLMRDGGARAVAMEVSSHALSLERVADVRFRVAVLTNVTRDHLDFHNTLEAYARAKRRLFELAATAVLNADDAYGARWAAELATEGRDVVCYGVASTATLVPREIDLTPEGSRFVLDGHRYDVRLPGRFNVWNALAAIGVARRLGVGDAALARGLASLERVPGRMERVGGDGVEVVVDYAHTPDALAHALAALRETTHGRLSVVFGCGGDRDEGKRPEMGAVAARLADRIYVTNDNPRGEEPGAIAAAIVSGLGAHPRVVELDRRRAIERAIGEARAGDAVLVAGKGHEDYQIVGDRVLPFDDVAVARQALAARVALP